MNQPARAAERWGGLDQTVKRTQPTMNQPACETERWGGLGEERRPLPPN
jgi:hypothetical protein